MESTVTRGRPPHALLPLPVLVPILTLSPFPGSGRASRIWARGGVAVERARAASVPDSRRRAAGELPFTPSPVTDLDLADYPRTCILMERIIVHPGEKISVEFEWRRTLRKLHPKSSPIYPTRVITEFYFDFETTVPTEAAKPPGKGVMKKHTTTAQGNAQTHEAGCHSVGIGTIGSSRGTQMAGTGGAMDVVQAVVSHTWHLGDGLDVAHLAVLACPDVPRSSLYFDEFIRDLVLHGTARHSTAEVHGAAQHRDIQYRAPPWHQPCTAVA
ncbi:hypothetical protein C8F04DRAFT_1177476 [Mycena alexandri]|uniref:Uncharacterized protein n=1 Tax=Mycena alexandri TaxID=1745969 RepID=A0AAD6XD40_9AGAR|nr:hypothetical protein C8F04DRAFT_1177476 [Mycena alexandri]